jgi:hypothetical protein
MITPTTKVLIDERRTSTSETDIRKIQEEIRMAEKPQCQLTGTDGNIFALTGRASTALRKAGQEENIKEMTDRIFNAESYREAFLIICEYVDAK